MLSNAILKELTTIVGKAHVLTAPEDLVAYSYDGTSVEHRPDAIVLPASTEQVSRVLQVCAREAIPVVPRGMGSGLAAASVPTTGGLSVCLTRMNRILNLDLANMMVEVEAGIVTADLQSQVEEVGLFCVKFLWADREEYLDTFKLMTKVMKTHGLRHIITSPLVIHFFSVSYDWDNEEAKQAKINHRDALLRWFRGEEQ